ncbi:MAG: patatin-like phospholipase family protein [Chitinivibrionales bacterium]|nr:patatin-like phospholipase family protein [Chitinivibrionales bacterium]
MTLRSIKTIVLLAALSTICYAAPKVAFVLSGGGSRALSQIGALKALDEAGIKPSLIVGTSMGSVIATLYACGFKPAAIESLFCSIDVDRFFENRAVRKSLFVGQKNEPGRYLFELRFTDDLQPVFPNSLSHGQAFYDVLSPLVAPYQYCATLNFDRLPTPLRIVATDIVTGASVIFSHGDIAAAIRASIGYPGTFSPVAIDSMLLVDGGLTANIPVDAAVSSGADYIIALDATSSLWKKEQLNSLIRLVDQIINEKIQKQKQMQLSLAHCTITPPLDGFFNSDFTRIDTLITIGYTAAQEKIPFIRSALSLLQQKNDTAAPPIDRDTLTYFHFISDSLRPQEPFDTLLPSFLNTIGNRKQQSVKQSIDSLLMHCSSSYISVDFHPSQGDTIDVSVRLNSIARFSIEGNEKTSSAFITTVSGLQQGQPVTTKAIARAITNIYATDLFYTVNVFVDANNVAHIQVKEKEFWKTRMGLRFDEYYLGEGYIQPSYENLFGSGISAHAHLQYGAMRGKYAVGLLLNKFRSSAWANGVGVQAYISLERVKEATKIKIYPLPNDSTFFFTKIMYYERSLIKNGLMFKVETQIGRIAMLEALMRFERFRIEQTDNGLIDAWGRFKNGLRYGQVRLTIDNLDRSPFPLRGHAFYVSIGGATDVLLESGAEQFLHCQMNFTTYETMREHNTFGLRLFFSWADQTVPLVDKIYIGGIIPEEKYRDIGVYNLVPFVGLWPCSFSGDIVSFLEGSYRFAFTKKLYLSLLADWGYAWQIKETITPVTFKFNTATVSYFFNHAPLGIGMSLAYQSFIGPIIISTGRVIGTRLEKEFSIKPTNKFYFSIGHDF